MSQQLIGLIAFAVINLSLVFFVTYLLDRLAELRARFNQVTVDNLKMRGLLRALGIVPPPVPPAEDGKL